MHGLAGHGRRYTMGIALPDPNLCQGKPCTRVHLFCGQFHLRAVPRARAEECAQCNRGPLARCPVRRAPVFSCGWRGDWQTDKHTASVLHRTRRPPALAYRHGLPPDSRLSRTTVSFYSGSSAAPLFLYVLITSGYCGWRCATVSLLAMYQHKCFLKDSTLNHFLVKVSLIPVLRGREFASGHGQGVGPEKRKM